MIGSTIGRYNITGKLGEGCMGVVYRGEDPSLSRIVAIKTLKIDRTAITLYQRKELIESLYYEAQVAAQLTHPNITTIYDVGESDGSPFIVMECVDGKTLEEAIKKEGSLSFEEKLKLIILSARALHYAHQRGVIHRDIKPSNIMFLEDLQVKITDFGIAKLSTNDSLSKTQQGSLVGTPHYMSPEHFSGKPINRGTDIYSLAVSAYELLSGQLPFKAKTLPSLISKIEKENPLALSEINPDIPGQVEKIIFKSLEKDPAKRHQTAAAFADDLDIFLNEENLKSTQNIPQLEGHEQSKIIGFLKKNYVLFSDLTDAEFINIFKICSKKVFQDGEVIFKEGTVSNEMYIILSGEVVIAKKHGEDASSELYTLKVGDSFGEKAFVNDAPHYASAVAKSYTVLVAINEVILRNANPILCLKIYKNLSSILSDKLQRSSEIHEKLKGQKESRALQVKKSIDIEKWRKLLQPSPFFKVFRMDELFEIMSVCEPKIYQEKENIVMEDEMCDAMYFIVRGRVEILKKSKDKNTLTPLGGLGQDNCFGESGVLLKKPRGATIRASEKTYLLRVSVNHIDRLSLETREKFYRQLASDLCVRLLRTSEMVAK